MALFVNPLSLISTIVDSAAARSCLSVNPLSLISTIVDFHKAVCACFGQSSFFNFYYCRSKRALAEALGQSSFFNFYYCRFDGDSKRIS